MNKLLFPFVVIATFALGFVAVWIWQAGDFGSLVSLMIPQVSCDVSSEVCRARMRADARVRLWLGDDRFGLAIYRRLALGGDAPSAFQIGWHHEEAYRNAVGPSLVAGTAIPEERQYAVAALPKDATFKALVDRYAAARSDAERLQASRALAFLWYKRAAEGGFGPAMNNLASMYQSGLTGKIDKAMARRWYVAAYDAGTPVAALNLERLRTAGYDDRQLDCQDLGSWLPLVIIPPVSYLFEDVIEETRFRGLRSDRTILQLIEMQMRQIPTPTAAEEAALKASLEVVASSAALASRAPGFGASLYGETPGNQGELPTFDQVREKALERSKDEADCRGIAPDPRIRRASLAMEDLMLKRARPEVAPIGQR